MRGNLFKRKYISPHEPRLQASSSSTVRIRIRSIQNWIKQESVYFLLCPQQGHKIEGVVLHTVCILVFCPKQSQGLKPSAASPGA